MKVQVEMINGKSYTFTYDQNIDELEQHVEFCEGNSFFLTEDGTRVMVKQIVTFKPLG